MFRRKKKAPSTADSLTKLRNSVTMLEKREDFLLKKMELETKKAKDALGKGNKKLALSHLKRKKTYESQVEKCGNARMTIESQMMALENASVSVEAMDSIKAGNASLKAIQKNMSVDTVEETMDEVRDRVEDQDEISAALGSNITGEYFDEDELEAELAGLATDDLDSELAALDAKLGSMPSAPSSTPATSTSMKKSEEDELRELEAAMAL
jgi:charged multivesicular body protein 4